MREQFAQRLYGKPAFRLNGKEGRLTAFHGHPIEKIGRMEDGPEIDWGKTEGTATKGCALSMGRFAVGGVRAPSIASRHFDDAGKYMKSWKILNSATSRPEDLGTFRVLCCEKRHARRWPAAPIKRGWPGSSGSGRTGR